MRKGTRMEEVISLELEVAKQCEVERRSRLLGDLLQQEYSYDLLRERAHCVLVPIQELRSWWLGWLQQGKEGLFPHHWQPLDDAAQKQVHQRYQQLMPLADTPEVTIDQVHELAITNGWSKRTGERWFQRYRIGGFWGLAPGYNPEKRYKRKPSAPQRKREIRAAGTLDAAAFETIEQRLQLLGDLAGKETVSRKEVLAQAQKVGKSERLIWEYWMAKRDYGLPGLAPKERSDKHAIHGLSPRMIGLVEGLRLSKRKRSVPRVHEEACKRARHLGEKEPSLWQVRMICTRLSKVDVALANGSTKDFRDGLEFTRDMREERLQESKIIYEVDHNRVDVLVRDLRDKKTKSKTIRPWLTLCYARRFRLVIAAIFSYDRPDRYVVAAVIRQAVLRTERKTYGGIPDEIWVDNGLELVSHHILQLTEGLGIVLHPCTPGQPQERGTEERFFGVLNTRLWSTLEGYISSNTVKRAPNVQAELTIAQLEQKFWEFIERYHNEEHSRLVDREGRRWTPLDYWYHHCWAESANPRDLDVLLMEPEQRRVVRTGIKCHGQYYWHRALADLVGRDVTVRTAPTYGRPETLEVFLEQQWICTAFSASSEPGKQVTGKEVADARLDQKKGAWRRIHDAQQVVKQADVEIAMQSSGQKTAQNTTSDEEQKEETALLLEPEKQNQPPKKRRQRDFLDDLLAQNDQASEVPERRENK
jgi:transposase InsO family protein